MDAEGYPEKNELLLIEKWPLNNPFGLIDYIQDRWTFSSIRRKLGKDEVTKDHILFIEFHTIGWSGNEQLIDALLKNIVFRQMYYVSWKKGGHHYFEIKYQSFGFKKVCQIAKEKNISRQSIHQNKHLYDWVDTGGKLKLCRPKKTINLQ